MSQNYFSLLIEQPVVSGALSPSGRSYHPNPLADPRNDRHFDEQAGTPTTPLLIFPG